MLTKGITDDWMTVCFRDCVWRPGLIESWERRALGLNECKMNNCKIITSSKCDLNVISRLLREKFSNRRHVVVVSKLITVENRSVRW